MSDKIRKRGGKAATAEDEDESSPAVILDDQGELPSSRFVQAETPLLIAPCVGLMVEQEQIVKEIKQEAKKANNLVQIVLCVFTGAAMLGWVFDRTKVDLVPFDERELTSFPPSHPLCFFFFSP